MKKLKAKFLEKDGIETEIEIDFIKLLQSYDKSIGDDSPENIMVLEAKMLCPIYKVSNTEVSSKNLMSWKKNEILLEYSRADLKWTKLNFTEFLWIQIVKELRDFGLSLTLIKKVKDELIYPIELKNQALKTLNTAYLLTYEENKNIPIDKLESISNMLVFQATTNNFNNVIQESIIMRVNMQLVIFKDGDAYFLEDGNDTLYKRYAPYNSNEFYDKATTANKAEKCLQPHLTISLTDIIKNYLLSEKKALIISSLGILTKEERELLELIRKDDIMQITINYKGKRINLVEVTETPKKVDIVSRYCDHVLKQGYQEIKYKTENGKLVTFTRTTKIKF
ncbi:MAG: hypothetical protein WCP69_04820 [Bacteroidota bacterium]